MASLRTDASRRKGPKGPLRARCSHCSATGAQLLQCTGCRAVRYCSREHQAANRPKHKSDCNRVKKARAKLAHEEDLVGKATPNAFETAVGSFWDILHARDYMRARHALAENLRLLGTLDSVREALDHFQDMIRLDKRDSMNVRDIVPALMLRLDLDQECYDFMKRWALIESGVAQPHLQSPGDVMEELGDFGGDLALCHMVVLLLLKLKLLADIRNICVIRGIPSFARLPAELQAKFLPALVRSPLAARLFQGHNTASLYEMEQTLTEHAVGLGETVAGLNSRFMFNLLFDQDPALCGAPELFSSESWKQKWGEMVYIMQRTYAAWWETEGVLDLLADARECAARALEDDIEEMRASHLASHPMAYQPTAKELLEDMSVNKMWDYMDGAIENASYLGPWDSRPSEIRRKTSGARWEGEPMF